MANGSALRANNGRGACAVFPAIPKDCKLLAPWDAGYKDPWFVVTNLAAHQADLLWYGYRTWIEASSRDCQSDGWRSSNSPMTDPNLAQRLWLAIMWQPCGCSLSALKLNLSKRLCPRAAILVGIVLHPSIPSSRLLSCFALGLIVLPILLSQHLPIRLPPLVPQPTLSFAWTRRVCGSHRKGQSIVC